MKNNFGNYVIQKALQFADPALKEELALKIQESVPFISNKKLKSNWNHIVDQCASNIASMNINPEEEH